MAVETKYGSITEEGIEQIRRRIGKEYPIEQPHIRYVNEDSIRHLVRAIGDINPLWTDRAHAEASRYGKLVAPPALLYALAWGSQDMRRGEGLPGVHGLHSGDHWFCYRPILDGDELRANKKFIALEERQGSYAGRSLLQVREFNFFNQRGELVARQHMPVIRTERTAGRDRGKYANIPTARYTDEEMAQIEADYDAEQIRGATPRHWEDVTVGEPVQPVVKGPLGITDMICWMMGIGTPHVRSGQYWLEYRRQSPMVAVKDPETGIPLPVERVHWDPFMAAEIGMPAPYDYGSQRGAWSTHLFTNWQGDDGFLAEVEVTYRGMNFMGDTLRIKGQVVDKWRGAKSGTGYVEIKMESINQRGDNIMPGRGVVALPSRENGPIDFPLDVEQDRPVG
ncbi:MAG: MaoC family dehydratase N-terminal domain-containing protein [Chloroflexota bacterium]|nr:MaoC family dehydratase N-terminal domain-containing protein [Chloroflexota bacterium]